MQKLAPVYRNAEDLKKGVGAIPLIMKKYKDVGIKDRSLIWNTDLVETLELENLLNQASHAHENWPDRDDVNWMKHTLSFLDARFVEDAAVRLDYRAVNDQPLDDEMHHVPPAKRVY